MRWQGGGVGFVFQKGLAQSSGFDAQFLKIILWPCTKLEGAAKLKLTSSITVVVIRKLRPEIKFPAKIYLTFSHRLSIR